MAALSAESMEIVELSQDYCINIKGIDLEYYLVEQGEVNILASEKYRLHPKYEYRFNPDLVLALGVYKNEKISFDIATNNYNIYKNLFDMGLLSYARFKTSF
jgi:hypothetical protein